MNLARRFRAFLGPLAIVGTLAITACVTANPPPPVAAVPPVAAAPPAAPAEPPPSAFLGMLRSHGIKVAIPTRGKAVVVNIPSYELIALQDGEPVLRSRVIVGKPASTTPEMLSPITGVRFNPSWTPTPSMIRNEAAHYMPPGPDNPLGRLMFEMENDELVYLHDTPQRDLFARRQRAFSHGCVRVEQARALAAWALGVSDEDIKSMIAQGSHSVPLAQDIPVFLVYYTRFPDESGQLVSWPDIYAGR